MILRYHERIDKQFIHLCNTAREFSTTNSLPKMQQREQYDTLVEYFFIAYIYTVTFLLDKNGISFFQDERDYIYKQVERLFYSSGSA